MITISGYREKPVIVREMETIIESLRSYADITISAETSGAYTLTSVGHGLNDYEVVTINDVDYVVSGVTDDTFNISAAAGVDFVGVTWYAKAPYFIFGHPNDIVSILKERGKSGTWQYQKYPLIALFQDFKENNNEVSLNLIIANRTEPTYHANDRYTENFEPVLYPIWKQLERALMIATNAEFLNADSYDKWDRLYWGKTGLYGNDGNLFDDHIDAIELNNLNLRFYTTCK